MASLVCYSTREMGKFATIESFHMSATYQKSDLTNPRNAPPLAMWFVRESDAGKAFWRAVGMHAKAEKRSANPKRKNSEAYFANF